MITVTCRCGRRFQTKDENADKATKCPVCGQPLTVPPLGTQTAVFAVPKERAAPPPWWDAKAPVDPARSAASTASGIGTGESQTRIITRPREEAPPKSASAPRPSKWAGRPALVAGGAVALVLGIGAALWIALADPTAGSGPSVATAPRDRGPRPSEPRPAGDDLADPSAGNPAAIAPPPEAGAPKAVEAGFPRMKLLVPAYFFPAGAGLKLWERMIESAARAPIVAIANPASGPGEAVNSDYRSIIGRANRRGVVVIGYVSTNFGQRPRPEVEADVDRWVGFYPEIRGIFFDAQPSDGAHAESYKLLRDYAKAKIDRALVVTNPGTVCSGEFAARAASDVLCIFESPSGFEKFRLPQWADRFPAGLFAALPHEISSPEQMRDCLQQGATRGIGLMYVTDAKTPNLWDRLPTYWDEEVEAVRKVNEGRIP